MDHTIKVNVNYNTEHKRWYSVYPGVLICDCHELAWDPMDMHSDDGRSLSCPLTPTDGK